MAENSEIDSLYEVEEDGLDLSVFEICLIALILLLVIPILVLAAIVLAPFMLIGAIVERLSRPFDNEENQ